MTDQVHVKGNYTFGNQWLIILGVGRNWFVNGRTWVLVVIWAVYSFYFLHGARNSAEVDEFLPWIIGGGVVVFVVPLYRSFIAVIAFASRSRLRALPCDIIFDTRGITLAGPSGSSSTFAWMDIKGLAEYDRAFVMTTRFILAIPKENFSTDELAIARRLTVEHLGPAARVRTQSETLFS